MKKIIYNGADINIKHMVDIMQQNFEELFINSLQKLSQAPTENLVVSMSYFNTSEKKVKVLTNLDPITWETLKFE